MKGKGLWIAAVVVVALSAAFLVDGETSSFFGGLVVATVLAFLASKKKAKPAYKKPVPPAPAPGYTAETEQPSFQPFASVSYAGGPLFGSWDTSIHLATGQIGRFGRGLYGNFEIRPFRRGSFKITGSKGNTYRVSLDSCECQDFQKRRLPCKHIYGLAVSMGYTAEDFYSCYVSAVCDGGKVRRPEIGYCNGLLKYQVHGVNPATGRKNKRFVFALDEADAVSAAHSAGLSDPVDVAGVVPPVFSPLEDYQKEVLRENDIAMPPAADWEDGQALLRRFDNGEDASIPVGLFEFAASVHYPCSLLCGGEYLLGQLSHKIPQRDQIALYAAAVLCSKAGQNIVDCPCNPVSEICYAFSDFASSDEHLKRQILNAITPQDLQKPDKRLSVYSAVLKFCGAR